MKRFAALFETLDTTTKTLEKIKALSTYLLNAPDEDKVWMIALFNGKRLRKPVNTTILKQWCKEETQLPDWLFDESYHTVGDLAETITLLLPPAKQYTEKTLSEWIGWIEALNTLSENEKKEAILSVWRSLPKNECFAFNKLLTGGFRIGVSRSLVIQALAQVTQQPANAITHQLMGSWDPRNITYEQLLNVEDAHISQPYPFYLSYAIDPSLLTNETLHEWQFEWKWDGIRAQIIKRNDEVFIWTRGEELVTDRYPELRAAAEKLPNGTVLDGEILAYKNNHPLPFGELQRRIGKLAPSTSLQDEVPVVCIVYDYLEQNSKDIRSLLLIERRNALQQLLSAVNDPHLPLSQILQIKTIASLETIKDDARKHAAEGLMVKRKSSIYGVGRRRGDWWKWKVDPYSLDAVLVYAQKGHGRRADLFTDYTFALWKDNVLVPFAKAYSGLTDKEIRVVDQFIRKNTKEKFGPVRTVTPKMVFEIAFENIVSSNRHKAKYAVRFPRIVRIRDDKKMEEADTIETLAQLAKQTYE